MAVSNSVSELASFEIGEVFDKASTVQFSQRDSRTLEAARKRVPKRVGVAKAELIYYSIYFTCVFGGKKYNNKGRGVGL